MYTGSSTKVYRSNQPPIAALLAHLRQAGQTKTADMVAKAHGLA